MESEESLTSDPGTPTVVGAEGCADNDMNVSWPEVESDLAGNTLAPIGYVRLEEEGATPMTEKQIRVIFEGVLSAYKNYSKERKFEVSAAAVGMQRIMTCDKSQSNEIVNKEGTTLSVREKKALQSEAKQRLKPMREIAREK